VWGEGVGDEERSDEETRAKPHASFKTKRRGEALLRFRESSNPSPYTLTLPPYSASSNQLGVGHRPTLSDRSSSRSGRTNGFSQP